MKIKCEYCGSFISDTDEKCPNCGAVNSHLIRSAIGIPKTIDELLAFCAANNMPLERMRFFIGENYEGPRAFGIYREEDGDFVVYKNKDNGTRAVRYRGKDEAYAVNEIYQKLKIEVQERRGASQNAPTYTPRRSSSSGSTLSKLVIGIIIAITLIILVTSCSIGSFVKSFFPIGGGFPFGGFSNDGGYSYDGGGYTYDDGGYTYDGDGSDYSPSYDDGSSYWDDDDWSSDWDDDDWDFDFGDWDSGGTDWGSDW